MNILSLLVCVAPPRSAVSTDVPDGVEPWLERGGEEPLVEPP
jgi:hypothetical protein